LEKLLLAPNEITITSPAREEEIKDILSHINHLVDVTIKKEGAYTKAHIKTDHEDVYEISRQIFFGFAEKNKALLEMALKKTDLEDIFIELTEKSNSIEARESKEVDQ